jgi:hypothetical protein
MTDPGSLRLILPVHGRRGLADLTDLRGPAGAIEDPHGRNRLPGIKVGHDADAAQPFAGREASHSVQVNVQ